MFKIIKLTASNGKQVRVNTDAIIAYIDVKDIENSNTHSYMTLIDNTKIYLQETSNEIDKAIERLG